MPVFGSTARNATPGNATLGFCAHTQSPAMPQLLSHIRPRQNPAMRGTAAHKPHWGYAATTWSCVLLLVLWAFPEIPMVPHHQWRAMLPYSRPGDLKRFRPTPTDTQNGTMTTHDKKTSSSYKLSTTNARNAMLCWMKNNASYGAGPHRAQIELRIFPRTWGEKSRVRRRRLCLLNGQGAPDEFLRRLSLCDRCGLVTT